MKNNYSVTLSKYAIHILSFWVANESYYRMTITFSVFLPNHRRIVIVSRSSIYRFPAKSRIYYSNVSCFQYFLSIATLWHKLRMLTRSLSGLNRCDSGIKKVEPKSLSTIVWPSCNRNKIRTYSRNNICICFRNTYVVIDSRRRATA